MVNFINEGVRYAIVNLFEQNFDILARSRSSNSISQNFFHRDGLEESFQITELFKFTNSSVLEFFFRKLRAAKMKISTLSPTSCETDERTWFQGYQLITYARRPSNYVEIFKRRAVELVKHHDNDDDVNKQTKFSNGSQSMFFPTRTMRGRSAKEPLFALKTRTETKRSNGLIDNKLVIFDC